MRWIEQQVNNLLVSSHVLKDDPLTHPSTGNLVKQWLSPHILELRAPTNELKSGIGAHVDHLNAFGDVIAGVTLGSDAVVRGYVRYGFTHEIPINKEEHVFMGQPIERTRRISIMIRDALLVEPPEYAKKKT
ncbi:UNVERIFIED_CONTAM: hypothetical protein HDU68_009913 [Siphonaria sp. JEL0065]|nr:hypothetical protein HDU68_009913 [Siphonaria sp. JEL0065]